MRFNYPESVRSLVEDEAKNCTRESSSTRPAVVGNASNSLIPN
jgi:hypothetical protein